MQVIERRDRTLSQNRNRRSRTGAAMASVGLLLILGDLAFVSLSRGMFAGIGPHAFTTLLYGAGGLALLYFSAELPLGAILWAAGAARMFSGSRRVGRVLWPLFLVYGVYFVYHGIAAFRHASVPTTTFGILGWISVVAFLVLVCQWALKRSKVEPQRQTALDLQMAGGLCVFTASWEACGLAGVPGFAVYPELTRKLANQSFLVGQAMSIQVFTIVGFICFLLAMRVQPS